MWGLVLQRTWGGECVVGPGGMEYWGWRHCRVWVMLTRWPLLMDSSQLLKLGYCNLVYISTSEIRECLVLAMFSDFQECWGNLFWLGLCGEFCTYQTKPICYCLIFIISLNSYKTIILFWQKMIVAISITQNRETIYSLSFVITFKCHLVKTSLGFLYPLIHSSKWSHYSSS